MTASVDHWNTVWRDKDPSTTSWYRPHGGLSLALLRRHVREGSAVLDMGGGRSPLAALLLAEYRSVDLTVADISEAATTALMLDLGDAADRVHTVVADAASWTPPRQFDVWHDRAAFHFLTDSDQRAGYI